MVEGGGRVAVVDGRRLLLEPRQLTLQVVDQQVGQVLAEPTFDDDPQRREVLAVLRERVRRQEPAALAQGVGDVEDREVVDPVLEREGEDRQLVTLGQELEGPQLGDPPGEPVATSRAYACTRR